MKKVFYLMAIVAMLSAVSCKKNNDNKKPDDGKTPVENPSEEPSKEPEYVCPITLDGDFSDWAKVDASKVQSATLVAEDTWGYPDIKAVKVYADELFVFVYMQFNEFELTAGSHYALYINGDNNSDTGGYAGQWEQGEKPCIDVLVMGTFWDPETGYVNDLACEVYTWTGEANADGWSWGDTEVSGFAEGKCNEKGIEFQLSRDLYPAGNWEDEFTMGFQMQNNGWDATGALPNAEPTDDNPSGKAPLLKVIVNK